MAKHVASRTWWQRWRPRAKVVVGAAAGALAAALTAAMPELQAALVFGLQPWQVIVGTTLLTQFAAYWAPPSPPNVP